MTVAGRSVLCREPVRPAELPLGGAARLGQGRLEADHRRRARVVQPRRRSGRAAEPGGGAARPRQAHDRRAAARRCSGSRPEATARSRTPPTAEQEERLRSLGYTAGSGGSGPLDDPTLPESADARRALRPPAGGDGGAGRGAGRAHSKTCSGSRGSTPGNPFAFGTLASMAYRLGSLPVAAQAFARDARTRSRSAGRAAELRQAAARARALRRFRAGAADRGGAERGRLAHADQPDRDARGGPQGR